MPDLRPIPTTIAEMQAQQAADYENQQALAVDLNRVQSAMLQAKLARGEITPEQAAAFREQAAHPQPPPAMDTIAPDPEPAPNLVPLRQPFTSGLSTTEPEPAVNPRDASLTPSPELPVARGPVHQNTGEPQGRVVNLSVNDSGASVSEST